MGVEWAGVGEEEDSIDLKTDDKNFPNTQRPAPTISEMSTVGGGVSRQGRIQGRQLSFSHGVITGKFPWTIFQFPRQAKINSLGCYR